MAEKYGVKPKMFTKPWWAYFWDYYKVHTLVIVFVAVLVGVTVYQQVTAPKYDINAVYAGSFGYDSEDLVLIETALSEYTEDVDGNGQRAVGIMQINGATDTQNAEYASTAMMKLDLQFTTNDIFLFIMDEAQAEQLNTRMGLKELFMPVSAWALTEPDKDMLYKPDSEEAGYAAKIPDAVREQYGFANHELYVAIKPNAKKDDKKAAAGEDSSIKVANALLGVNQK